MSIGLFQSEWWDSVFSDLKNADGSRDISVARVATFRLDGSVESMKGMESGTRGGVMLKKKV